MTIYVCRACGTSFAEADAAPDRCRICDDERQYVPASGQSWTTRPALAAAHVNAWRLLEPDLFEIRTVPAFAISQRALLVRTPIGNILWDCIALLDDATVALIEALGGLTAIAISHPHYYTCMQDWAQAFDAPVYLHANDRAWVMRPDRRLEFWDGDRLEIGGSLTLVRLGGHFPGGAVLHWKTGADGHGALMSGDIVQVAADTGQVSFLWSYPNMMPLAASTVTRIAAALEPLAFERIYGAFAGREVLRDAKQVVARSAKHYVDLLNGHQA